MAVPSVPPAPGRFSTTMDWPSSAASPSSTTRGTTSAALPAPNGIVALISRDGQFSACAAAAANRHPNTTAKRIDFCMNRFRMNRSGFIFTPPA